MPKQTTNYQLNQWAPEDSFLRADFNEDNAKIDAALKAEQEARAAADAELAAQVAEKALASDLSGLIVTGTYTGTATGADLSITQNIDLGFQPRFLLVRNASYKGSNSIGDNWTPHELGFAVPGFGTWTGEHTQILKITETGFTCGGANGYFNYSGNTYTYLAIR
jgi:hypothetical protein